MSWIKTIAPEDATGLLKQEYVKAVKRAGKVYNIVRIMSLNPATLRDSMRLYLSAVKGDSPLSRAQREMIAVVVSKTNNCHY